MDDRAVLALAGVAVLAARLAPAVPGPVVAVSAGAALFVVGRERRPAGHPAPQRVVLLVALALALLVAARAASALHGLARPVPDVVEGTGLVRTDPDPVPGGVSLHLEVAGRRYLVQAPSSVAPTWSTTTVGARWRVSGRTSPLRGVPPAWVRSHHLAARLTLRRAAPGPPPAWWDRVADGVRTTVVRGGAAVPERDRPLYLGLVVGDDRGQSPLVRHQFRAAGLAHLLAVSGQNVAFALAAAAPVVRAAPRRARPVVALGVLALFTAVVRPEASVLRAVAMASVVLVAGGLGRPVGARRAVAVAVVALLVADPMLVHSTGFRLSLAATLGLVLLARPLADRLQFLGRAAVPLATALAAQIATIPVLVPMAGGVPVVGPAANLLAVPPAGAVMVLGLTVGPIAGLLPSPLATLLQWPTSALVRWTAEVAAVAARAPFPLLGPARLVVLAGGAVAGARVARRTGRSAAAVVVVGAMAVAVAPAPVLPGVVAVAPGVVLGVGRCGGRVLLVTGTPRRGDRALDGLRRSPPGRLDLVVAAGGRGSVAFARDVAAVAGARRLVVPGPAAPVGFAPAGAGRLAVGGVQVDLVDPGGPGRPGRAGLSAAPCTVGP